MEEKLSREKLTIVAIIVIIAIAGIGGYLVLKGEEEIEEGEGKEGVPTSFDIAATWTAYCSQITGELTKSSVFEQGIVPELSLCVEFDFHNYDPEQFFEFRNKGFIQVKGPNGSIIWVNTWENAGVVSRIDTSSPGSLVVIGPPEMQLPFPLPEDAPIGTYEILFKITGLNIEGTGTVTINFEVIPPTPAEIRVGNLCIEPSQVELGRAVAVYVGVGNYGGQPGDYTVELRINGEVWGTETVHLRGGRGTAVTFYVLAPKEGTYVVEVDGLTGSFKVV